MTDRLDQHPRVVALLDGPLGWHTVQHHATVGSTQDVARELLEGGMPPGAVIVADHQTAGRGRRGRPWHDGHSGDGQQRSLSVSVTIAAPASDGTLAPLAVGLAVADALRRAGGAPELKWPNDVLLPGGDGLAKCAGILVDRRTVAGEDVLIVGVGIDLDWRGVDRDDEASAWTSVAESCGREVDRGDVLADLLRGLVVWLRSVPTHPRRLLLAYRGACATIGQTVRVTFPDGAHLEGRAIDLEREGRLVVESPELGQVAVTAGDVEHVRPS